MVARFLVTLFAFAGAPASAAAASAPVPEGSNLTLYALGVLGVLVGRKLSTRRNPREDEGE